jgi:HEAT repeat protein
VALLAPQLASENRVSAEGAAEGLVAQGEAAVAALEAQLDEKQLNASLWSLEVLRRIGPAASSTAGRVVSCLEAQQPSLRAAAARTLFAIAPRHRGAEEALVRRLEDVDDGVQAEALRALGAFATHSDTALQTVVEWIDKTDAKRERLRILAVEAIGPLGARGKPAIGALVRCLREPTEKQALREAAIAGLAALGMLAFDDLVIALKSSAEPVRGGAAQAIGRIGPEAKKAVDPLIEVVKARTESSWYAARALTAIGKPALRELMKLLDGPDTWIQQIAVTALGEMGPEAKPALKRIRQLTRAGDPALAEAATRAVAQISR